MNERDKELAVECRLLAKHTGGVYTDSLQEFADLIRADERKKCSKTRAGKPRILPSVGSGALWSEQNCCFDKGWHEGAAAVREAIRSRGKT
jgi:hypothetical protein